MVKKVEEKKKESKLEIVVPKLNLGVLKIKIQGKTPLLMDKFPESVREEILDKQLGKTKGKKKIRDLNWEYENAIHKISDKVIGFPAQGFKSAMIESTSFVGAKDFSKKLLKGIQIVNSEGNDLIPITYKKLSKLKHYPKDSNTKYLQC